MILDNEKLKELREKYEITISPSYIDYTEKRFVLYRCEESGGYRGGNCWDDTIPSKYTQSIPDFNELKDLALELKPDLSFQEYRELEKAVLDSDHTDYEYYGNSTDYLVEWIPIATICEILGIEATFTDDISYFGK